MNWVGVPVNWKKYNLAIEATLTGPLLLFDFTDTFGDKQILLLYYSFKFLPYYARAFKFAECFILESSINTAFGSKKPTFSTAYLPCQEYSRLVLTTQ